MLDMVQAIRAISNAQDNPEPILVHCSAGVGRTGTFIAVYKLIEDFYDEKYIKLVEKNQTQILLGRSN